MGVVGLGAIGRQHVARLADVDLPVQLAGVCDFDEALTRRFADEHDVPGVTSLDDFLTLDLDAVVIAVPSGLHRDLAVAALDAGRHVLLEKPIDITVAASDDILRAARASGKVLSVVSQRRFAPANQFLKQLIDGGSLGRVTSASVEVPLWRTQEYYDSAGWRGTWEMDGGGALMNQGVHLVDLALWLLGDVEEVYAHAGLLAHERIEVEDTLTLTARFSSGALMTFLVTTAANTPPPIRMSVMGTRGTIVTVEEKVTYFCTDEGEQQPDIEPLSGTEMEQMEWLQRRQLADFVEAAQGGVGALVRPEEARNAVAFIEAAYESARTGRAVRPAPLPG